MPSNYYIGDDQVKGSSPTAEDYLTRIAHARSLVDSRLCVDSKAAGRNFWTRFLDAMLRGIRRYVPPLHWIGATLIAILLFTYIRVVALTIRLRSKGTPEWPDMPAPGVIVLWHRDAPALLVAFAKRHPRSRSVIMISRDVRGDMLALLCRILGFAVVRGGGGEGGWLALLELVEELTNGASVFMTADGGGPARVAKVGAIALASAANVPIVPISVECSPAIEEHHKWDSARNPLPFSSVTISVRSPRVFPRFNDLASIEQATPWLESALNSIDLDRT